MTSKPLLILPFFGPLKGLLVPKLSTVSRERIRGPTRSGKALNLIY